jgi:hypothetical protein
MLLRHEGFRSLVTYRTRAGRQFILIVTGMGTENSLIAFALNQP